MAAAALTAAIEAIWQRSREETERRIATLEAAVTALEAGELPATLRAEAERDAHKLAGALGMFGFPTGSERARAIEQALAGEAAPGASDQVRIAAGVRVLRAELEARPAAGGEPVAAPGGDPEGDPTEPVVLVVGADDGLHARLAKESLRRGLSVRRATTSADARRHCAAVPPAAAVLDVRFSEQHMVDDLGLIEDLAGGQPPIPVVVLTGSERLLDRVEVARRGASSFLARTRPARQVLDILEETIARRARSDATILALDDDPAISAALAALLTAEGLGVTTINDPLALWDALEAVRPDLLVLDLDMPGPNGIDLCRAVRTDRRFGQLLVVFLTSRTDRASVQQIFEAGADDYVAKPIIAAELVTRIRNRLERVTLLRQLAERDGLTGVSERHASTALMEDLLLMSERFDEPLALAVIDLDHFKALNDRLGHAAGDAALQRLAALLQEVFRGEDVIGRWGGDEFVVGMYGMTAADGIRRLESVLASFREEDFRGRDGRGARVTFSAGVAAYPGDGTELHELYKTADAALYAAKAAGAGRVLAAGAGAG